MKLIDANGVKLNYQTFGDQQDPVILLIHGLGMPMTAWPMVFIDQLVAANYCVLRFDNRDMGLSERFDHLTLPNLSWHFTKLKLGLKPKTPYSLDDMKNDAVALLDALGIEKAHVVGLSMGGMISQLMAISAPERLITLTSIMSHTSNPKLPKPTPEVSAHVMSKPKSSELEDVVAFHMKTWKLLASPNYPMAEGELQQYIMQNLEHGISPMGTFRQMLAIMSSPSRVKDLKQLTVPSLVIHGDADPLIRVDGGIDTAQAISNATLKIIKGMGHDLPDSLVPQITTSIIEHLQANAQ